MAASAGLLAWALVERIRHGATTSMGAASGLVAALVAITPACGAVSPLGAVAIGAIAGAVCSLAIEWKFRLGFDDSLDVVGVHLVGGIIGTLLIGIFATSSAPNGVSGLLYGGGLRQLGIQSIATVAVLAYSFGLTWVLAKVVDMAMGLRIQRRGRTSRHRPRRPLGIRLPDRRRPSEPGRRTPVLSRGRAPLGLPALALGHRIGPGWGHRLA